MSNNLAELRDYVREAVPCPRALLQLKENETAGRVTFIWLGVEFFVKPSLHVFEVRGHALYITRLSTLLQAVRVEIVNSMQTNCSVVEARHHARRCGIALALNLVRSMRMPFSVENRAKNPRGHWRARPFTQ
jgi:hypothetical protein